MISWTNKVIELAVRSKDGVSLNTISLKEVGTETSDFICSGTKWGEIKKVSSMKMQITACSVRHYKDAPLNEVIAYKLNSDTAANH